MVFNVVIKRLFYRGGHRRRSVIYYIGLIAATVQWWRCDRHNFPSIRSSLLRSLYILFSFVYGEYCKSSDGSYVCTYITSYMHVYVRVVTVHIVYLANKQATCAILISTGQGRTSECVRAAPSALAIANWSGDHPKKKDDLFYWFKYNPVDGRSRFLTYFFFLNMHFFFNLIL